MQSPRITSLSWGKVEVEGHGRFKDVKLYPGGCREWNWSETGTNHKPGIQFTDVRELLDHGATVVVLAAGFNRRLQVCDETLEMLKERGVTAYVLQTEKAVRLINELRESEPVGGLIHSTC